MNEPEPTTLSGYLLRQTEEFFRMSASARSQSSRFRITWTPMLQKPTEGLSTNGGSSREKSSSNSSSAEHVLKSRPGSSCARAARMAALSLNRLMARTRSSLRTLSAIQASAFSEFV